jgi:hypothetical protein
MLPFGKGFGLDMRPAISSERIISDVLLTDNTSSGTVTYLHEVNALQLFLDLETALSYEFLIGGEVMLRPSFGAGTSIGINKEANQYGYLVPGLQIRFQKLLLNGSLKFAHYNVELKQNEELFDNPPLEYFVRPRVVQVGVGYRF